MVVAAVRARVDPSSCLKGLTPLLDGLKSEAVRRGAARHWLFFRQWMRAPLSTASMVPSSRHLARAMVAHLGPEVRRVVELGPGTGVITEALLAHGIVPSELMLVELNGEMHATLVEQFPGCHVIHGDARALPVFCAQTPGFAGPPVDAVLSGLGFLSMPDGIVEEILRGCFEVLRTDAPLVLFTYGPRVPVKPHLMQKLGLVSRRVDFIVRNFPPASVYEVRRA